MRPDSLQITARGRVAFQLFETEQLHRDSSTNNRNNPQTRGGTTSSDTNLQPLGGADMITFLSPEFRDNMTDDRNQNQQMAFTESDIEKVRFSRNTLPVWVFTCWKKTRIHRFRYIISMIKSRWLKSLKWNYFHRCAKTRFVIFLKYAVFQNRLIRGRVVVGTQWVEKQKKIIHKKTRLGLNIVVDMLNGSFFHFLSRRWLR